MSPRSQREARRRVEALGRLVRRWRSDREASLDAEIRLLALAQSGDRLAQGEIMQLHRGRVRGVCWRLRVRRLDLDDYVQEGLLAMLTPIRRYDLTRRVPFWFYARPYVRGTVVDQLGARHGLTSHQLRFYRRVWEAHQAVSEVAGAPTPEAVRAHLRSVGVSRPGVRTIEAILEAGTLRSVRYDDERDSAAYPA